MNRHMTFMLVAVLFFGCSRSAKDPDEAHSIVDWSPPLSAKNATSEPQGGLLAPHSPNVAAITPPTTTDADFSFLILGNSHVGVGNPFGQLQAMIEHRPDKPTVACKFLEAPFLRMFAHMTIEPSNQPPKWVVLQGQEYSTSGTRDYPIDTAIDLAKGFKASGSRVLLMPEWRTQDKVVGTQRILHVYERIADAAGVEVVPVGLVWDPILDEHPEWPLHAGDGNHSNDLGATVTALAFYCWLFDEVPTTEDFGESSEQRKLFCQTALDVCRRYRKSRGQAIANPSQHGTEDAGAGVPRN